MLSGAVVGRLLVALSEGSLAPPRSSSSRLSHSRSACESLDPGFVALEVVVSLAWPCCQLPPCISAFGPAYVPLPWPLARIVG